MADETKIWPGHTDEGHPEIFNRIPPRAPGPLLPGQLSEDQLKQFVEDGYLLIESFFTREELDPVKEAIDKLVDDLANRLYNAGHIKSLYREYGQYERLTKIEKEFVGANIVMLKQISLPEAMSNIWANERALNLAEQILGTKDIAGHAVWNLRTKIPNNEATTVPWHQDVAYLDNDAYNTYQLTAWMPLLDTTKENGCMQLIKKGHKTGLVADHQCCSGGTWYVMMIEDDIKNKLKCNIDTDTVTCPVPYGGMLIFNKPHATQNLNNVSDQIRWSLDFRWQHADARDCFFGQKQTIRMRSSTDPNYKIDWVPFNSVNRHVKAFEELGQIEKEFDTTVPGPWMQKWENVHTNLHTAALSPDGKIDWHNMTVVG